MGVVCSRTSASGWLVTSSAIRRIMRLGGFAVRGDARVVRVDRHAAEDVATLEQHDRGPDLGDPVRRAQAAGSRRR